MAKPNLKSAASELLGQLTQGVVRLMGLMGLPDNSSEWVPPEWGVVIIAGGTKFLYRDGSDCKKR